MDEHHEQDLENYRMLLTLWQSENPIKTIKLQFLLASNAGLLGFFALATDNTTWLAAGGCVLNVIWVLSIGRTSLFQKAWKNKLDEIAARHADDARFQILDIRAAEARAAGWLRFLGGVSSKYYLLGAPVGFAIAWCIVALLGSH